MVKYILKKSIITKLHCVKHWSAHTRCISTSIKHFRAKPSDQCPPKEECPKPKGKGKYYALGAIVLGTGAVVAYAKYDNEFRIQVEESLPGFDKFVSFVTLEETTLTDFLVRQASVIQGKLKKVAIDLTTPAPSEEELKELEKKAKKKKDKEPPKPLPPCDDNLKPYIRMCALHDVLCERVQKSL